VIHPVQREERHQVRLHFFRGVGVILERHVERPAAHVAIDSEVMTDLVPQRARWKLPSAFRSSACEIRREASPCDSESVFSCSALMSIRLAGCRHAHIEACARLYRHRCASTRPPPPCHPRARGIVRRPGALSRAAAPACGMLQRPVSITVNASRSEPSNGSPN